MRRLLSYIVALFVVSLVAPACKPIEKIDWPKAVQCGPNIDDLIGTVSRILLSGGKTWKDELIDLARVHGNETVICIVDRLKHDWSQPTAARTPERNGEGDDPGGLGRATEFLHDTGTEITRSY